MKQYTFGGFINRYKSRYIPGVIWLIIVDLLQLVIPWLLGDLTDQLKNHQLETAGIIKYALLIILVALGTAFFRYLWRLYIIGTSLKLEKNLREDFYRHLQSLSLNFFHSQKTGDLMAHATNDINAVRRAMGPGIVLAADSLFLTISTIAILLIKIDIRLTLLALIPLPFLSVITVKFGKMIHQRFRSVQKAFSRLTERVQENFSGIRVVKAFVQEDEEIENFSRANLHNYQKNIELVKVWGLFWPLIQFISGLSFLIVLWYGGILVIRNTITLGDFVAFNSYLGMLTWPMMALGFVINTLQRGAASLDRLNDIFQNRPEIHDHPAVLPVRELAGKIEFRNLNFRYNPEGEYVLKNINLTIEPGETAALIGRTGSGKTTLVNLLLRLYDPGPGELLLDGNDITRLPLQLIREKIGYVPQDDFLFSTSISSNIAFADPRLTREEIEEAARKARIYENIMEFSRGFETQLGERGITLSGGQKQRVSIARALAKDPRILILDDSLSAVDTRTEELILTNLKEIRSGRTSILISHRISTIKDADRIFVLDQGRIIEEGSHLSLLEKQGLYYQLYQKQLLEEKLAES